MVSDTSSTLRQQHAHTHGILMILDAAIDRFECGGKLEPDLAAAVWEYLSAYSGDMQRLVSPTAHSVKTLAKLPSSAIVAKGVSPSSIKMSAGRDVLPLTALYALRSHIAALAPLSRPVLD